LDRQKLKMGPEKSSPFRIKMNKKIWINKSGFFEAAQDFDFKYYLSMSGKERLETVQFLRESNFKFEKGLKHEDRERLRRIIKVIQHAYGREKVYFIGLDDLIQAKKLSNRPQDKVDLDLLIKAKGK
jgi:hypothetical protein